MQTSACTIAGPTGSYHNVLFKGYIWRHRRPWWRECEIDLMTDEITYTWEERGGG